jgi:hypothetical protein
MTHQAFKKMGLSQMYGHSHTPSYLQINRYEQRKKEALRHEISVKGG